ncbi:MAG: hypothetical protein ACP5KA_07120 [Desulfurococcaceae archaeon]
MEGAPSSPNIVVELREDKWNDYEEFRRALIESGFFADEPKTEELFKRVKDYISSELRPSIEAILRLLRLDIESPPPRVENGRFNLGQWIGTLLLSGGLAVHVKPKVGWSLFDVMVKESLELPAVLGVESLAPLLANLIASSEYVVDIVYSDLAYRYTLMALEHPMPRIVESYTIIAEGQVGRLDAKATARLRSQGLPLVASRRARLVEHVPALVLIARFHYSILTRLQELRTKLRGDLERLGVASRLEELMVRHQYILSLDPIAAYLDLVASPYISDSDLVREVRAKSGANAWLKVLADLYEAYQRSVAGVEVYKPRLPLRLLPSSKVFELWTLRLIVDSIGAKRLRTLSRGGGIVLELGDNITLYYNLSESGELTEKLREMKLLKDGSLRPDYVLKCNSKVVVADAKYKYRLALSDLERMLAYVVDLAKPVPGNGDRLPGLIVMLTKKRPRTSVVARNEVLKVKPELLLVHVNPRERANSVEELRKVLRKLGVPT